MKPTSKPQRPFFSSGPCAKRPGWTTAALDGVCAGRSHRSKPGKAKITEALNLSRAVLGLPDDYHIAIMPGSDTGAVEAALWSLLGERGVDVLAWESFGEGWVTDIVKQLKLTDVNVYKAGYGELPDLSKVDCNRDVVFTWNGTTSGVRVPNGDWIAADRQGLTICDATSAAFAMDLPWSKLDVVTYSWQKVLGGEGAHGILILSPRAVQRLESYTPPWPLPKLFRLTAKGKFAAGIFQGDTINTPSMLCVEDYLDALRWAESIGGLPALIQRCDSNFGLIADWVAQSNWAGFLAQAPESRSTTSVCLSVVDPAFQKLSPEEQAAFTKKLAALLDKEGVAYDIGGYRDAPPGLRIWAGATVEADDLRALLPWLDWAYAEAAAA
ncbi:phosphoserine transaminase [Methylogaea oryzae]|uniref:Phosphoserine aminotransferase n=2 Tax=Methylogaea oryzae TaxID=1295382 RepID=A0A8D4VLE8_9GAMM|nr:phosphoserine transaminase [Methylogaea oryzae]BBL70008.1 phosphoserine aminotransferase [Methylogaea oryzae]